MLRVAGLRSQSWWQANEEATTSPSFDGVLVEFAGVRLLVDCPWGAASQLASLGVAVSELRAVLATSAESLAGWPEVWAARDGGDHSNPLDRMLATRLLGTAPVLLGAESHLATLSEAAHRYHDALGRPGSEPSPKLLLPELPKARVAAALAVAEEVSLHQEVVLEGPEGPVIVSAASSGSTVGGVYWVLEAHGVRVALIGPASCSGLRSPVETIPSLPVPVHLPLQPKSLCRASVLVAFCMSSAAATGSSPLQCVAEAAADAARTLKDGGSVLVPYDCNASILVNLLETLCGAITEMPAAAQAPVLVVGSLSRWLRRCSSFAEWVHSERASRAHHGHAPLAMEALQRSGRLVLADSMPELSDRYKEPCVVVAPAPSLLHGGAAARFCSMWASRGHAKKARLLLLDAGAAAVARVAAHGLRHFSHLVPQGLLDKEVDFLLEATQGATAVVPSSAASKKRRVELRPDSLVDVPIDMRAPSATCWLSPAAAEQVSAAVPLALGGKAPSDVCRFDGVLVGRKRPRITPRSASAASGLPPPAPALLVGRLEVKALIEALAGRGHSAHAAAGFAAGVAPSSVEVVVPSLGAKLILNAEDPDGDVQTTVVAKSRVARQLLSEVLEGLLVVL